MQHVLSKMCYHTEVYGIANSALSLLRSPDLTHLNSEAVLFDTSERYVDKFALAGRVIEQHSMT